MSVTAKHVVRVAFWIVFLAGAGFAARQIWVKLDPLRNHPVLGPWWLRHNYATRSHDGGTTSASSLARAEAGANLFGEHEAAAAAELSGAGEPRAACRMGLFWCVRKTRRGRRVSIN